MHKKIQIIAMVILSFSMVCTLSGCQNAQADTMQDGYYSAEAADYVHDWKEFVTILVRDNTIVTVEYNAKNASGFIKSWDMDYMRNMNSLRGTYPNEYTRTYAASLIASQDPSQIDAISGASTSYKSFQKLASAAIDNAKEGDSTVAIVDTTEE